ncbi:MAG: hypothetical protein MJ188_10190 [Treponema sp.]|nr:hypothetical protein [Treponema sp.]
MEHIDFNLDWKFYKTHADWEEGINVSIFGDSDAVIQGIGTTKGDVEIKVEASKKENILYKIKLN